MKVAVIGTGYVGLVSGVCLAAKGHDVTCVDLNPRIVEKLNIGEPTIYEKGLQALLTEVIKSGRFKASGDLSVALDSCEIALIAVGTPSDQGVIDLSYIEAAARSIGHYIRTHDVFLSVVVKSTVVPGTTNGVVRRALEDASGKALGAFGLGMNPEFLREGEAISDFDEPDRIILGYEDKRTREILEELYAPWSTDKMFVNTRTAEMIKYANNALLATQISAANEIANLSATIGGIDILDVIKGVSLDKRWNPIVDGQRCLPHILTYLVPGVGFGGSCFPKDVQAIRSQGESYGLPMHLMNAVLNVNAAQPSQVVSILRMECGDLSGKKVLLLGLAFKPGTDDVRESASIRIASDLLDNGVVLSAHDPIASDHFADAVGDQASEIVFIDGWRGAVASSGIIIVATQWADYQPLQDMALDGKVIFDARRMFSPERMLGATYLTIGRRVAE